jgi:hypothetical protein
MTKERLTLRKIREILRLKEESKLSNRAIARACKISNSTVGEYLQRAQTAGLHWPLPEGQSEDELYQKLFPESNNESTPERSLPDKKHPDGLESGHAASGMCGSNAQNSPVGSRLYPTNMPRNFSRHP